MQSIVVIPARLESSRLPKKVLLALEGKSMLQRVYEQCIKANSITSGVYIATDSLEIQKACQHFTDNIIMTDSSHQSGTDRIAQAVAEIECDIVVNVQGDEPFIDPDLISKIADGISSNTPMSSAMQRIYNISELKNPSVVKVVVNKQHQALYFSRSIIPNHRDGWEMLTEHHQTIPDALHFYRHIGIYGYSKKFLLEYSHMEQSYLERVEKLEQLRVLENGYNIQMIPTKHSAFGIDTAEDYNKAKERIKAEYDKQ